MGRGLWCKPAGRFGLRLAAPRAYTKRAEQCGTRNRLAHPALGVRVSFFITIFLYYADNTRAASEVA